MTKTLRRSKLGLAVALATLTTGGQHAFAQNANLFVEEILVTARKQTESIQDVPLSLSAFSANEIEVQAIETTEDVIKLSPGLTFTRGIGGQDLRPDIRGLTPLSGRANIAILVDGVDITSDSLVGTGAGQLLSLGLYDLERIEVVRGPQSALFGRSAFGGAINYITKKPSAEFEGSVNVELAEWDTSKVKVGVSGPITENILYRVNLAYADVGGQYENTVTAENAALNNEYELGAERNNSASIALQFLPSDELEILTRLDYSDQTTGQKPVGSVEANTCFTNNYDAEVIVIPNPADIRNCGAEATALGEPGASARQAGTVPDFDEDLIQLSSDSRLGTETELFQFTTLVNYEIGDDYTFSSNTSYTDLKGRDSFDLDHKPTTTQVGDCVFGPPAFVPGSCASEGLGFQLSQAIFPFVNAANPFNYINDRDYQREAYFQDFRLSFDSGEDLRWLIGAEYAYEELALEDYSSANASNRVRNVPSTVTGVTGFSFGGGPPTPIIQTLSWDGSPNEAERETTSFGVYGSVDWLFEEDWEISLSFRYQEDEFDIEYDNTVNTVISPAIGLLDPSNPITKADGDFDAFNPRIVLTNFYNDDIMLYFSIAKGTKPGGHTIEPDISSAPGADVDKLTYEQESLTSYEFGWKTSWMNDRVIANGAIFFMENTDKQANNREYVTTTGSTRSFVDNIGETEVRGLELQVTGVITAFWTANLNYAFIETEVTNFDNQSAYGIPAPARGTPADVAIAAALADPDADQAGNDLPYTPKHNLQISNTFEFGVTDSLDGFVRVDGRYLSERFMTTDNANKLDDYVIWDIKAGVRSDDFEVVAFLDNVENDDTAASGVTFPTFSQNLRGQALLNPNDKRTAGVRVKYNF